MKIKKWNGSAWVQDYPEVDVGSIVATGTPSGTTFLRGDGTWSVPAGVDSYVNITGDTMTGALSMGSTVAHPGNSTPTALAYGKLTGFGSFFVNADTDGSTTEFLYLTAGYGQGAGASNEGMRIGYAENTLTWKGHRIFTDNYHPDANVLTTARTIGIGTGAVGTATSFNGSANITIPITGVSESYLTWGGKHLSGQVTPIGMSLSNELSANRIAFINGAGLDFEYSSDSGTTWTNYNYTATQKSQFCTTALGVPIGRISGEYFTTSRTRVTLTAQNGTTGYVYTNPRKMLINVASSGGMDVLVETRTGVNFQSSGAWSTVGTYSLSGWSGWNDIPLVLGTLGGGTTQTGNNWQLRLTFIMTSKNATYPTTADVTSIRIFGENAWQTPSNLAATNDLYTYDMSQNALFPAIVQGTRFTSTIATGTSPLTVTSTTAVTNLNADLLDGNHASAFALDNTVVKLTGSQSISGTKTFTDSIFLNGSINTDGGTITINADSLIVDGAISAGGVIQGTRFTSTQATGTAPLTVASTTVVTNLNADLLDGNHASAFAAAVHTHAIADVTGLQTAIDARIPLTQKGAASGVVPLNSSSKIDETYLPNFIFGGMRYISSIGGNTTAESLLDSAQTYITSNGGTVSGCYFIVSGTATVTITGGTDTNNGVTHTFSPGPINMTGEEGDNVFDTIDLEPGDWLVINDTWGPYFSVTYQRWSVVNNTYALVTTTAPGIMTAADKTKLDGIATSANNYSHPTDGANSTITNANGLVLSSITVNTLGHVTAVGSKTLAAADIPTLNQNTTGSAATLTTARTLTLGSTGKTFNGSADVSWSLAEIGAAPTAGSTSITTLGTISTGTWTASTIAVTRGGTGTTSVNQGGVVFGSTGGGSYTSTSTPSALNQYLGVTGGANNQPIWTSPADSQSATAIGTGSALTTERDIYYGLPFINNSHTYTSATTIYAPTAGGTANYGLFGNGTTSAPIWDRDHTTLLAGVSMTNNSYTGTAVTITNYRYILIQMFITATNTTQRNFILIDTADTKQLASATSGTTFWRMQWNDGTSSWADTVTIRRASSTTMDFLINSGVTWTARVTGFRGSA